MPRPREHRALGEVDGSTAGRAGRRGPVAAAAALSRADLAVGPSSVHGACVGSRDWDLDAGGPAQWIDSLLACHDCPVMTECRAELDATYPGWSKRARTGGTRNPAGVIWAGWAFSDAGTVLTEPGLRRFASQQRHTRTAETPATATTTLWEAS